MAGRRNVQDPDRHPILDGIEKVADQIARVQRNRFARLENDLDAVFFADAADFPDQPLDVIARTGDVMAAAEIDPL